VAAVEGFTLHSREPGDPYFGLDLWLQTSCCGKTLWARNADHLSFLSDYVRAEIRERATGLEPGAYRNKRMSSRLPRWLTDAKNRQDVLKCIDDLRARLPGDS
jgi:hypothetical protein